MLKKIFITLFIMLMAITNVHAATCGTYVLYEVSEWQDHTNLIDADLAASTVYTNSYGAAFRITAYGELGFPNTLPTSYFTNSATYTSNSTGKEQYLLIQFDNADKLKLSNIQFNISAVKKDGSYATWHMYENGYYQASTGFTMGKQLATGSNAGTYTIDLGNKSYNSILWRFDDPTEISYYTISYLQIPSYSYYHPNGQWSRDYIEGAATKTETYCINPGKWSPDGTSTWVETTTMTFNATASAIFSYSPTATTGWNVMDYDWARGAYVAQNSTPPMSYTDIVYGTYSSFSSLTSGYNLGAFSYWGSDGKARNTSGGTLFYSNDGKTAREFKFERVYWDRNSSGSISSSTDSSWAYHVSGSYSVPVYKHTGHTSNSRVNCFTVYYRQYSVPDASAQTITSSKVYWIDTITNEKTLISSTTGSAANKSDTVVPIINEPSGIYALQAVVKDSVGQSATITSKNIYIDTEAPTGGFTASPAGWSKVIPSYTISANDESKGSGLNKITITTMWSPDGTVWYSDNTFDILDYGLANSSSSARNTSYTKTKQFTMAGKPYYKASALIYDVAGHMTKVDSGVYKYDVIKPWATTESIVPLNDTNWTNSDIDIRIKVGDNESGLSTVVVYKDGVKIGNAQRQSYIDGVYTDISTPFNGEKEGWIRYTATENGQYEFRVTDIAGNTYSHYIDIKNIDKDGPKLQLISYDPKRYKDDGTLNWVNTDVAVNFLATDSSSGIKKLMIYDNTFNVNNKDAYTPIKTYDITSPVKSYDFTWVAVQNVYDYYVYAEDAVGNWTVLKYTVDHIDKVKPDIELYSYAPDRYDSYNEKNWTNGNVILTFYVKDDLSKLNTVYLSRNGSNISTLATPTGMTESYIKYEATINIYEAENYNVTVTDRAGNKSSLPLVVDTIDKVKPVISGILADVCAGEYYSVLDENNLMEIQVGDSLSGVNFWEYQIAYSDNGNPVYTPWVTINNSTSEKVQMPTNSVSTITVRVYDKAGNVNNVDSCEYNPAFHIGDLLDSDIALVDYNYVFAIYNKNYGVVSPTNPLNADKANGYITLLKDEDNESAETALRYIENLTDAGVSKEDAVKQFFDTFLYDRY